MNRKQTKIVKSYLFVVCILIAMLLLIDSAIHLEKILLDQRGTVSVHFSENTKIVTDMSENIIYAAWRQDNNELIENKDLDIAESVSLIQIYGREDIVMSVHFLHGNYMISQDYNGCIISQSVARTLFHSIDVLGREITYQGKVYYVRGVFKKNEKLFVIQSRQTTKAVFPNYEFKCVEQKEQAYKQISNLLEQKDFPEAIILRDGNTIVTLVTAIRMLPIGILLGFIFLNRPSTKGHLVMRLFLGGVLLTVLLRYSVVLPEEWIPTKWSDFHFWVIKYHAIKDYLQKDIYNPNSYKEVYHKTLLICYVILVSAISFVECFVLNRIKKNKVIILRIFDKIIKSVIR